MAAAMLTRFIPVLVMGSMALALSGSLPLFAPLEAADAFALAAVMAFAVIAMIVATVIRSRTVRVAWGRSCFIIGFLSAVLAGLGLAVQKEPYWPAGSSYQRDMATAFGPTLPQAAIWTLAAYGTVIALLLSAILFILGYWLLHSRR
jgi:hypothetical protein